jgi:hypothetical protein
MRPNTILRMAPRRGGNGLSVSSLEEHDRRRYDQVDCQADENHEWWARKPTVDEFSYSYVRQSAEG